MKNETGKRGQVTIFIILGIVIVSAVLVFFIWIRPEYLSQTGGRLNFESCVRDSVVGAVSELEKNAGYINPEFTYNHKGEQIVYLCYTNEDYRTCTIQKPFLKQHFEEELKKYITSDVENCYANSVSILREEGYDVVSGRVNFSVSIEPESIDVLADAPTAVGSAGYSRFNIKTPSPLYDMLMISTSLLQFEARYGDTDTDSINDFYPDYFVEKLKMDDGTTIYTLTSKLYRNEFKFASRSLAWPAGYGWE